MSSEHFEYNRDIARRDSILGVGPSKHGELLKFRLPSASVGILLDERFVDPDGVQNESPLARVFYQFMRLHPTENLHAVGYAYPNSPEAVIDSLEGERLSPGAIEDFVTAFGKADEFQINPNGLTRCWYD